MSLGFDRPLYILPFDHRGSFETGMFDWRDPLTSEQATTGSQKPSRSSTRASKQPSVAEHLTKRPVFWSTSSSAAAILRQAKTDGFIIACPAEKSGQDEFDFEYGDNFAAHIEKFQPTFCKVLVRYNAEGNQALNRRQAARLKQLSDYLHGNGRSLFMFELLVPPEQAQLERVKATRRLTMRRFGRFSWCMRLKSFRAHT